jgi:hypothetical protein
MLTRLLLLSILSGSFLTLNAYFIIPIKVKAENIVSVAKNRADFKDPVSAINSITDANATNRYLLRIATGTYELQEALIMKEYVDIVGAGIGATKLIGSISTNEFNSRSAIVSGANNASLSNMQIQNRGGNNRSFAIYNNNASPTLHDLNLSSYGGSLDTDAIYNFNANPLVLNVIMNVSGDYHNVGIYNRENSSPNLINITINVTDGKYTDGILNFRTSSPRVVNASIICSGASTQNYAIHSRNDSFPIIIDSYIEAQYGSAGRYAIHTTIAAHSYLHNSQILGDIANSNCQNCTGVVGLALDENCQIPE